jgi:hypothetical protein
MPLPSKSQHRVRISLIWESPRVSFKGRWYNMTPEQKQAFIDAVTKATGRPPLVEGDHYHVELGSE